MKTTILALVLAIFSVTAGFTAPLADEEKKFVALALVIAIYPQFCPNYVLTDPDVIVKHGDRNGVDGRRFRLAVQAALDTAGERYDRDALIPEVTRWVNELLSGSLLKQIEDRKNFCAEWSPTLMQLNLVKSKSRLRD